MNAIRITYMILNLPYSALRAYEAVVRHSSFSIAATELNVSQSAISQHVKSLEDWLGQELLIRGARQSVATREGEQLAEAIRDGLGRISNVCSRLRDRKRADKTIVISCLPGFAFTWLFPRLMRFDMAHPEISISIATDTGVRSFTGAEADIGIRYGFGAHPGLHAEQLIQESLFPVCAPALLQGPNGLRTVQDLKRFTLLQDENQSYGDLAPTWHFWAKNCGVTLPEGLQTRRFGQANLVIQAAIEGIGVALGREPLVIDALHDGRLVRPFSEITLSPLSYWIVHRPEMNDSLKVTEFLNWIRSEVRAQKKLPPPVESCN